MAIFSNYPVLFLFFIIYLIFTIVFRLHGRSWFFILLWLLPFAGGYALFIHYFLPLPLNTEAFTSLSAKGMTVYWLPFSGLQEAIERGEILAYISNLFPLATAGVAFGAGLTGLLKSKKHCWIKNFVQAFLPPVLCLGMHLMIDLLTGRQLKIIDTMDVLVYTASYFVGNILYRTILHANPQWEEQLFLLKSTDSVYEEEEL